MTAVRDAASEEFGDGKAVRNEIKAKLFAATSTCDRGFFASKEERTEVDLLIRQLCDLNPTQVPTKGLLGSQSRDNETADSDCTLAGR